MHTTVPSAPRPISICSNRSLPRRLRAVGAIFAALAVLGVGWGLVEASAIVPAATAAAVVLGA